LTAAEIIIALMALDTCELSTALAAGQAELAARALKRQQSTAMGGEWLTPEEAAAELQYSRPRIYELIKDGSLCCMRDKDKHGKDKRLIRIRREWLDEFIREREMRGPLPLRVSNATNIMLVSKHDERGSETASQTPGAHPGRVGQKAGRSRTDSRALGNRPSEHP
jgi:excisionase family DNA binding protein